MADEVGVGKWIGMQSAEECGGWLVLAEILGVASLQEKS